MNPLRTFLLAPCIALSFWACGPESGSKDAPVEFDDFPDPGAWSIAGPGGPDVVQSALNEPCAALLGGPEDIEHHNLVSIHDGWLVMPWSPEDGTGGISVFDISDPCSPEKVGEAWDPRMRESHTLAFGDVGDRTFLAVDYHEELADGEVIGGVGFWELTDPTNPVWVSELALPNYFYPDSYVRVTLSTFWQGDAVYVSGASNGVFIVDASDPTNPRHVGTAKLDTPHLVGTFHAVGNVAMSASAGLARTVMMDISDPWDPVPIPGGDFQVTDEDDVPRSYYFSNVGGKYAYFPRNSDGGGPVIYDISDPAAPVKVGAAPTPDGDGGYVFRHEDHLFVGDSNFGSIYDISDPTAPVETARLQLQGDFDTLTPIGNVAIGSVDAGGAPGQATMVYPWAEQPDSSGPVAEWTSPGDGDTLQALTSRIGVSFTEQIEARSAHAGSFRVWTADGAAVPGRFHVQENLVNFTPDEPLEPDTTYVVALPDGGLADVSGNPTESSTEWRFSTGAEVRE